MENNNYFDELIVSYLSRELNEEEEVFVLEWINSSEEHKQYFEKLKSAWILLGAKQTAKNINIESEWNQFKQIISAKKLIDSELEPISALPEPLIEENRNRKTRFGRLLGVSSLICCIVIAFALTWKVAYIKPSLPKTRMSAARKAPSGSSGIQHVNTTDSSKYLILQDGTGVLVHPKSEITYHKPFVGNRREITLIGKADFTVPKNKTKPFTVLSGDLSTTALGTHFTVTAYGHEKSIVVTLYEGKVVVKSGSGTKRKLERDFYLVPGDELVYNNRSITASIHKFENKNDFPPKRLNNAHGKQLVDNPSLPSIRKGTWYMFNNQPLNKVYDQLEVIYGIDIVYKKSEVSRIYFIGPFNVTDSLEAVLTKISGINNLKVIKANKGFVITK
jgi:ferric-dicitrate binding protein FerR (iron transport regulator)